jgi:hypothetical protein
MALGGAKKILAVENGDTFMGSLKVSTFVRTEKKVTDSRPVARPGTDRVPVVLFVYVVSVDNANRNWKMLHRTRSKCCL